MSQHRHTLAFALCAVLAIAGHIYAATPQYTVTDLGAFQPNAIAGPWIVGQEAGLPTRLNLDTSEKITLEHWGHGGVANAVLISGEGVGTIKIPASAGGVHDAATFWDAAGQFVLLPGPLPSFAMAINDAWTIAGYSLSCPGGMRAMRWWPDGREECLPGETGQINVGRAIDGQHRVWGRADDRSGPHVAV
jgi:hypothetical protein